MPARLSIIGTPIGNLEDITLRALRTLQECDVIFAEDTRVTAKLLARHAIVSKPLHRLDAHASETQYARIADTLRDGQHAVFVSDAGTPAISDPGTVLVAYIARTCPAVPIEPIPGPSALTAIMSICHFPVHTFTFWGFLPVKKGRAAALRRVTEHTVSSILYESPFRIIRTLDALAPMLGERQIVVGRELTKLHETVYRGTVSEVIQALQAGSMKGEFVIAIAGGGA